MSREFSARLTNFSPSKNMKISLDDLVTAFFVLAGAVLVALLIWGTYLVFLIETEMHRAPF